MVIKYSDCCNALYDEDIARCKECGENCGYWQEFEMDDIKSHDYQYKKVKEITINLNDGRCFTITRDWGAYESDCDDSTIFDFEIYWNNEEFTEEEKESLMNLYYDGEFEEWLQW